MSTHLIQTLKQYQHNGTRWVFIFPKSSKRKGQCKVIHCKRLARVEVTRKKGKLYTSHRSVCDTCACRLFRANNPAKEAYRQIKDRALRRNQIFCLTFNEFLTAIEGTEYLSRRGTGIGELHLDRKKVHLGYVPGNLQVLTTAENLRKQREVDYCTGPF
jgi:hypothetical protein